MCFLLKDVQIKKMEPQEDKEENIELPDQEPVSRKGLVKRLVDLLTPWRPPDTTEELESEIQELLEDGEEHGLISSLEEKMIKSIFDFRDTTAVEVMTPAANIVSHDLARPIDELIRVVIEKGLTRIPVYKGSADHITGILHAKDLLKICIGFSGQDVKLEEYLLPAYFIPESKPIVDLLKEFQKKKIHMAMVTDEFGTVRGLITMEDILEEIVGEIDDEYDVGEATIEEIGPHSVRVKGWVDVEDVEERFRLVLPEGPYESVAGLLIHTLGRLGEKGDRVEIGPLRFTIQEATPRRIEQVTITRVEQEDKRE